MVFPFTRLKFIRLVFGIDHTYRLYINFSVVEFIVGSSLTGLTWISVHNLSPLNYLTGEMFAEDISLLGNS